MDENISDGMSEYEKDRLKRIDENRKKLEELFPDGPVGLRVGRGRDREQTPEGEGEEGSAGSSYGSPVDRVRRPRTR